MDKRDIRSVLDKVSRGDASAEEQEMAKLWLHQLHADEDGGHSAEELEQVSAQMWESLQVGKVKPVRKIKLWPRIAVAASLLLMLTFGLYYYKTSKVSKVETLVFQNDVAPGRDGATLTLASGKKILISGKASGDVALESGVRISKNKEGQLVYEVLESGDNTDLSYNTLSTSRGQQSQVRLPDGSLVFLNAGSSLRYAVGMGRLPVREVSLSGEGYFEVAKDKSRPFVVSSGTQRVEVLGTHFNVQAYEVAKIETTLLEGSVRVGLGVSAGASVVGKSRVLVPGEQAVFDGKGLKVSSVDVDRVVAWKEGFFVFGGRDLAGVMEDVARWYNVQVEFDSQELKGLRFSGSVSRYDNVSQVLKVLEGVHPVKFVIKGRVIRVEGRSSE